MTPKKPVARPDLLPLANRNARLPLWRPLAWQTIFLATVTVLTLGCLVREQGFSACSVGQSAHNSIWGSSPCFTKALDQLPDTGLSISRVQTSPSFFYAHLAADEGSRSVGNKSVLAIDPVLTAIFMNKTRECCGRGGHFVDVGSQFGYYSMLAASMGCSFSAFEPVSSYRSVIALNQRLNAVENIGRIHRYAIGHRAANATMAVPTTGDLGAARIVKRGSLIEEPTEAGISVSVRTLDQIAVSDSNLASGEICAMRISARGYEPYAFVGAKKIMESQRVRAVMMDWEPSVVKNNGFFMDSLVKSAELGYWAYQIDETVAKQRMHPDNVDVAAVLNDKMTFKTGDLKKMYLYVRDTKKKVLWMEQIPPGYEEPKTA